MLFKEVLFSKFNTLFRTEIDNYLLLNYI